MSEFSGAVFVTILYTDRLILRQFQDRDLDAYAAMSSDPEVMRYIGTGRTLSREESWRSMAMLLGHWQLRGYGLWAVESKASGEFLGRVGLWNPAGWPGLEVGWALRRSAWGQGFATEAARAAVNYGFELLQQSEIISLIRPENTASIRIAERLGAKPHEEIEVFGSAAICYRLDRQTWQASVARGAK
ncbi:GNAT family N-acetyltransferase [filamentous cyanobacterium LEGE 11480]|uniref:GNAT family N-acetyltransferase n=1 Tax=Romeriopsis navalis LEGE 11480 TaxID=2777977 RepID=A0A928Z575_9CYAN|nr:GNAT family N-acetyltransferase [Romeriopsis navalis]MBE9031173.1 GNAT family N-acetyltransferase [Romeriopsis navalis LEGE 11480]